MAAVLQFRRKAAPAGWANDELAEFYRIVDVMGRAGLAISVDVGVSDEGEPWVAFVREDSGDVLAHIARIDGWIVAVSAASNEIVRAQSLKEVVRRIVDSHPLVLLPAHRPGSHVHVHPCAVLAAFIAAAYMLAEGVRSEANAREFAESVAADHAAASAAALAAQPAPKVAAHPNPLRGALTSIADFLRGVGDLAQPVSINATAANAAIAAVVALALSGDDLGGSNSRPAGSNDEDAAAALSAVAAASAAEADAAAPRVAAPQHVVGLDAALMDPEFKTEMAKASNLFAQDAQPAEQAERAAAQEHAASESSVEIAATAPIRPIEAVARPIVDLSVAAHAAAAAATVEAANERAAKPAASESISSAPSTVAGANPASAANPDFGSATAHATAAAPTRPAPSDAATDLAGLHASGQAEVTVLRLSDISKYALTALRITDALIGALDRVTVSAAKTDQTDMTGAATTLTLTSAAASDAVTLKTGEASFGAGSAASSAFSTSAYAGASAIGAEPVTPLAKAPSANAAHIDVTDFSSAGSTGSGGMAVASATSGSSLSTGASAASVTTSAAQTPAAPSASDPAVSRPSTAYDIITGILSFAFGDHPVFAASAAARADIAQDLARHGMATTNQRVLIFSSETVTVPVFELMPGVVLVDGLEIAREHRAPRALEITSASKVIYLPDGGALNLIGVIDFSVAV